MATIGNLSVTISANAQAFHTAINNVNLKVNQLRENVEKKGAGGAGFLGGLFIGAGVEATRLASVLSDQVLRAMKDIVSRSVELAANLELTRVGFEVMTGDPKVGTKLMEDLMKFAVATTYSIDDTTKAATKLLAAGMEVGDIVPIMKILGDVSLGSSEKFLRNALAFSQVATKGRLMGGELKQFSEAGVPLLEYLRKQLGKTNAEILKMEEAGLISFSMVGKALEAMTAEGGRFFGAQEKAMQTTTGIWNSLRETFVLTLAAMGKEMIEGTGLNRGMQTLTGMLANLPALAQQLRPTFEAFGRVAGLAFRIAAAAAQVLFGEMKNLGGIVTDAAPTWEKFKETALDVTEAIGNAMIALYQTMKRITGVLFKILQPIAAISEKVLSPGKSLEKYADILPEGLAQPLAAKKALREAAEDIKNLSREMSKGLLGDPANMAANWKAAMDKVRKGTDLAGVAVEDFLGKIGKPKWPVDWEDAFAGMEKAAGKLTEKFQDPVVKFRETMKQLEDLVAFGFIELEVYSNAAADAFGDLEKLLPKHEKMERPAALLKGSKEAYSQVLKIQDREGLGDPLNDMRKKLTSIDEHIRFVREYNRRLVQMLPELEGEILHVP